LGRSRENHKLTIQGLIIRELKREDLTEVNVIFKEFVKYHEQWDGIFEKVVSAEEAWSNYVYASHTQDEKCRVFVAELNGKIVGYCLGRIVEKPPIYQAKLIGQVDNIGVKEGYKRQGIGEKLFSRVKEWFKEQGVHHIEVEAATANPQSVNFWRKMGGREFIKRMEIRVL
jgi:ribosomal protein S18 acetylase RimI-like enzyme